MDGRPWSMGCECSTLPLKCGVYEGDPSDPWKVLEGSLTWEGTPGMLSLILVRTILFKWK